METLERPDDVTALLALDPLFVILTINVHSVTRLRELSGFVLGEAVLNHFG